METTKPTTQQKGLTWQGKVILVVEDEEISYKFLETVVADTKASVLHAKSGREAIDFVKNQNRIDLILMDIKMPEMDGFEAAREIRKLNHEIPIIVQTAYPIKDDGVNIDIPVYDDFILKPIDIFLLKEKMQKFIN